MPTSADKLRFILTYLKQHPMQEVQGQLFGMSQAQASQWMHLLLPVLTQALADQELLPARTADALAAMLTTHQTEDSTPAPPVWHDGTERPIQRPTEPEAQQEYDRGKKTCHTLKNLLVIHEVCHMCFLSHTYERKASDKNLAELSGDSLPPGNCLNQDKGFQGFFLHGITIVQPKKISPGGELTPPEQAPNRRISSIRMQIEHVIGGVKRDRIVTDNMRLLKDGIRDAVMEACCGLHNFRLQY